MTLAVCCSACGNTRKPVYPVQGKVVYNGKAVPQALVVFHPVGGTTKDAARPSAHTDNEGQFTLTTYVSNDGAPLGEYVVTVHWTPLVKTREGDLTPGPDKLPAVYGKPDTTKLRIWVNEGPTRSPST